MDEVNKVLQRIARGTGIVFAETVVSMLFSFFNCCYGKILFKSGITVYGLN